jgi:hypothetical protein
MTMNKGILLILFLLCGLLPVYGQKKLLIEKAGNPRTERISLYDELTFKLKEDDTGWYMRQILDMNAQGQMILLGDNWLPISDIDRIRLKRQRVITNIVGGALQGGGATMILGDLWYTLRGNPEYTQGGIEFGFLNIGVGTAVRALFSPIKYKLGGRKRLKVVDLTF